MVKSGVGTKGQSMKVVNFGIREQLDLKTEGDTRPSNKSHLSRIKKAYVRTGWTVIATTLVNFSLTTFVPSGKLVQIEHALAAVSQGTSSRGIKATNGVVIATGEDGIDPGVGHEVVIQPIEETTIKLLDGREW
ncbi:hypothetical protein BY996DRAFT_6425334 [Phakopsora pachyrhizi]|nr:hypothetical protein BY996DRAFT_6425334 [Phakopsora pachyrhizi]